MADQTFPCLVYKPEGQYCKVTDQDEYDRAKAEGFTDDPPTDWNNTPDPATPGGTSPLVECPVPPARAEKAHPSAHPHGKKDDK